MEACKFYVAIFCLIALSCFNVLGSRGTIREDMLTEEIKLKRQEEQAKSQTATKSQRALNKISKHLAYTVYSDDIRTGVKSFILDPTKASIALAWKKMTKKQKKQQKLQQRMEREIYDHDTRSIILSATHKRMYPFSAVAQVFPECTGTVIGHRYILTAAECIHDGNNLLKTIDKLRVGLYDQAVDYDPREADRPWSTFINWYSVSKVFVPNGWRWRLDPNRYNYAVLQVSNAHFNSCMGLEGNANMQVSKRNRIHFSSFERLHPRGDLQLMYRFCHMEENSMMYVYEQCDATSEATGAGMYFRFWTGPHRYWDRKIIAVKSDKQKRINITGEAGGTMVGMDLRITPLVFAQICFWVSDDPQSCGKGVISNQCFRRS